VTVKCQAASPTLGLPMRNTTRTRFNISVQPSTDRTLKHPTEKASTKILSSQKLDSTHQVYRRSVIDRNHVQDGATPAC
jgi:hypothetical protein